MSRRKFVIGVVILFILFSIMPNVAKSSSYFMKFTLNSSYFTDAVGKRYKTPVKVQLKDGVLLVPLRAVVEDAGGIVRYFPLTKSISLDYGKNSGYISLLTGSCRVNGSKFQSSVKPFVKSGHTLIDVRFVSRLFGGNPVFSRTGCTLFFYKILDIKDVLGDELCLCKEPKRIVSLAPNLTEILFAIGAGSKVVGVSNYSNYPKQTASIPKVGGFFNPSIEKIFALNPQVVLVARGTPIAVINKLSSLRIKVFASDPKTIPDIYNLILNVGKITGNVKESVALVNKLKSEENSVEEKVKKIPESKRLKVYVEIWNNPKMSAGKGTFIDSLIREAGGINIAEKAKGDWPVMSDETIIKENPDVIILLYNGDPKKIALRPGWSSINAVKNHRIYVENPDIFERPGPRIIQALEKLYEILYGDNGG